MHWHLYKLVCVLNLQKLCCVYNSCHEGTSQLDRWNLGDNPCSTLHIWPSRTKKKSHHQTDNRSWWSHAWMETQYVLFLPTVFEDNEWLDVFLPNPCLGSSVWNHPTCRNSRCCCQRPRSVSRGRKNHPRSSGRKHQKSPWKVAISFLTARSNQQPCGLWAAVCQTQCSLPSASSDSWQRLQSNARCPRERHNLSPSGFLGHCNNLNTVVSSIYPDNSKWCPSQYPLFLPSCLGNRENRENCFCLCDTLGKHEHDVELQ